MVSALYVLLAIIHPVGCSELKGQILDIGIIPETPNLKKHVTVIEKLEKKPTLLFSFLWVSMGHLYAILYSVFRGLYSVSFYKKISTFSKIDNLHEPTVKSHNVY